ncbi:MAG TPA: OB-fold domain-containing protein [Acidimicrobiia bacterium]
MPRLVENTIQFPYKRSLGPVFGAFMTGLVRRRILGIRCRDSVLVPPLEWDPQTGASLDPDDLVEVGPAGTVVNWTWVAEPTAQHPLDHPFGFALILLDGAGTPMVHAVDTGDRAALSTGMRVAPRWRAERLGTINDIEAFVPGEEPVVPAGEPDVVPEPDEPVTMMEYNASITYRNPVSENGERAFAAGAEERLLGQRCPVCGRTYAGGRGFCPIDSTELTQEHDVDLPQRGVVSNYTIITPVQYPGQTETEPFARVMVRLDGVDVVLGFQDLIDVPVEEIRPGLRVAAMWASDAERADTLSARGGVSGLVGWIPTGEPDDPNPDLLDHVL